MQMNLCITSLSIHFRLYLCCMHIFPTHILLSFGKWQQADAHPHAYSFIASLTNGGLSNWASGRA